MTGPRIEARLTGEDDRHFDLAVTVREGESATTHQVTLSRDHHHRYATAHESPEDLVVRCFEFLLRREPKESILRRFDIGQIEDYFPEFEDVIGAPSRED
ncbi:MAG: hypothetical protein ABR518_03080 [Actinomycetota bacterium]